MSHDLKSEAERHFRQLPGDPGQTTRAERFLKWRVQRERAASEARRLEKQRRMRNRTAGKPG